MVKLRNVKIVSTGIETHLIIDGVDVSENCTFYQLSQDAGFPPALHIEFFVPVESLEIEQNAAEVEEVERT